MTERPEPRVRLFSVKEYAQAWGVHEQTVRAWIKKGILETARHGPRGCIRIRVRFDTDESSSKA